MSYSMSITGVGPAERLVSEQRVTKARMDELLRQAGTGRRAEDYSGLGSTGTRRSIDLRAEADRRETYKSTITRVEGRLGATQVSLDRIASIADEFITRVNRMSSGLPNDVESGRRLAREALREVATILNGSYEGEYLFSGTDTANAPIPGGGAILSSPFVAQIAAEVAGLTATNAATVTANTIALAQSDAAGTTPFSTFLSNPATGLTEARRSFIASDRIPVEFSVSANRNATAASSGADTTGAWSRDLMRGLAVLASVDPAQGSIEPGFRDMLNGVRNTLRSVNTALADERGALGETQRRVETLKNEHNRVDLLLQSQIADVEEVDLAEVLTRLTQVRTQLEASYKLIASLSDLSLTRFIR